MTNPLMQRPLAADNEHPVTKDDWQQWCAKMNAGHHKWGSDLHFYLLPHERGGVYPKTVRYRNFGTSAYVASRDNRYRAHKYFEAAGVPDGDIQAIFERAQADVDAKA